MTRCEGTDLRKWSMLLTNPEYCLCLQPHTASLKSPNYWIHCLLGHHYGLLWSRQCSQAGNFASVLNASHCNHHRSRFKDGHGHPKQIALRTYLGRHLKVKLDFQHSTKWLIPIWVLDLSWVGIWGHAVFISLFQTDLHLVGNIQISDFF